MIGCLTAASVWLLLVLAGCILMIAFSAVIFTASICASDSPVVAPLPSTRSRAWSVPLNRTWRFLSCRRPLASWQLVHMGRVVVVIFPPRPLFTVSRTAWSLRWLKMPCHVTRA